MILLECFIFEKPAAFCQNGYVSANITAKQALKKKYRKWKVNSTLKYNVIKNEPYKAQVPYFEPLDTLENPYDILIRLGLFHENIQNISPRDSFLLLYSHAQKINDTSFYLYPLPPVDTSFLQLHNMGSHPWFSPQIINFNSSGQIKNITSGGGAGEECCAGGDQWLQTIWFKDHKSFSSTHHTQGVNEEIETEWDPTCTFPISIKKQRGSDSNYCKSIYTYHFRNGILRKLTEAVEDSSAKKNMVILYKYHYKR